MQKLTNIDSAIIDLLVQRINVSRELTQKGYKVPILSIEFYLETLADQGLLSGVVLEKIKPTSV